MIILDGDKTKFSSSSSDDVVKTSNTDASIEVIIEEEAKSRSQDSSKASEKSIHNQQVTGHMITAKSTKQPNSRTTDTESQLEVPVKSAKIDREQKPDSKRSSKTQPRSSKRRISSRVKQQRTGRIGTDIFHHKEESNKTMTTTTMTTTNTTIATVINITMTTTPPSIIPSEMRVVEQIDSHIFEEPESQTFKDTNTRAIDQHHATY